MATDTRGRRDDTGRAPYLVGANEARSTGPTYERWPADFPQIAYVTADGGLLCVTCANGGNGSRAADVDLDPATPDDAQWRIVGAQTLENRPIADRACAHCGRRIPDAIAPGLVGIDRRGPR